jgi:hypothetical protein
MIIGQSAGVAAAQALRSGQQVQLAVAVKVCVGAAAAWSGELVILFLFHSLA